MRNRKLALVALLMLSATPAFAQHAEAEREAAGAAGDSATAHGPGTEHHTGGPNEADEAEADPSKHFNYFGIKPGHLFDYIGKDEYGGPFGDGQMVVPGGDGGAGGDPHTQRVIHEEEPASPPYVFMLFNFAILLAILAWKGWPIAQKVAVERHDLIKTALDEAAKLRKQAADKLAEYESRLSDADAEITKMVEGMRQDAENDGKRIRAAAEAMVAQMKHDAELRIAAEIELARAQLTREVTAASAAATEKLLREKMTASDQNKLVSTFISEVQNAGTAPRGSGKPTGEGQVR